MANPKLIVEVAGDSRQLTRTLKQTETQTQAWARRLSSATGSSSLGVLGGKGFLGAAAVGVGVAGLKQIIDASSNAQQVLGQTRVALDDAGLSWEKYGSAIDKSVAAQSKLGFDDEEQLKAISTFARATGDVGKALELSALSADVARGRYIDLASASNIVLKAQLGNSGALRRLGIDAEKGASSIELLSLLTKKYGGNAQAAFGDAATANERLGVSLQNVEETIGSGALPVVAALANSMADAADSASILAGKAQDLGLSFDFPTKSGKLLGHSLSDFVTFYPILKDVLGGTKDEVDNLGTSLNKTSSAAQGLKVSLVGLSGGTFGVTPLDPLLGKDPPKRKKGITADQRNQFFDNDLSRQLDKNQDIPSLQKQVQDLRRIEGLLEKRIAATKDVTRKLTLEDQLRSVRRQERGVNETIAANAAQAKQTATLAKQQADATRLAQRTARQFRELGLGADGSEVTPGVANLKNRVGNIANAVEGTKFDTPKLQSQLARFRKVLGEGLVPKDVRSKIDAMLKEINDAINANAKQGGPLTKTTQLNSERILSGLGLGVEQERTIRARLSHFNSAGKALSGTGSGSANVNLTSYTVVDGQVIAKTSSKYNGRKKKVNTAPRNGPNAGGYVGA